MKVIIKTVVSLIVTVGMIMAMASCGSNDQYVGTWKATVATMDNTELEIDKIVGDFTMDLDADGTATIKVNGNEGTGKWEKTDNGITLKNDDDNMDFVSTDDGLSVDQNGIKLFFERIE